jgi:hypothetical protein
MVARSDLTGKHGLPRQPCGSRATGRPFMDNRLADGRPEGRSGEKSLYMGGRVPHMHDPEKRPMHSGARGGGILIA